MRCYSVFTFGFVSLKPEEGSKSTEVAQFLGDHRLRRGLAFRGRDVYEIKDRAL
jgi:hypothetical protein